MPKDQRLYAKFTLDFAESHKIKPLSDAAFRALMEMIFWSRRQLTDGFIPKRLALASWPLEVCSELLHNDDEKPSLIELENGYQIHDFAEHQTTRAEIEARSEVRKAAGRKGGVASGRSRREAKTKQPRSKTNPETETETHNSTTDKSVVEGPRKRGTRLQRDWEPATTVVSAMRTERPDIDLRAEHDKFIDYWTAKPGKDALKLDWEATWRNWMRNAKTPLRAVVNGHVPTQSTSDRRVAEVQALKRTTPTRMELE